MSWKLPSFGKIKMPSAASALGLLHATKPPPITVPAGTNFFANLKHNYEQVVPVAEDGSSGSSGKIGTMAFVEATADFTEMFTVKESLAMDICWSELAKNTEKVRKFFLANPITADTLDGLVAEEEKQKPKSKEGQLGLFWLFVGLDNAQRAIGVQLQNITGSSAIELKDAFSYAYALTLARWHNSTVQMVYEKALSNAPARDEFLGMLGDDRQKLVVDGLKWHEGITKVIDALRPLVEGQVAKNIGMTPKQGRALTEKELQYNDRERK